MAEIQPQEKEKDRVSTKWKFTLRASDDYERVFGLKRIQQKENTWKSNNRESSRCVWGSAVVNMYLLEFRKFITKVVILSLAASSATWADANARGALWDSALTEWNSDSLFKCLNGLSVSGGQETEITSH